jgi:hypothetical protein
MRKITLLFFSLLIIISFVPAQEIIENPEKPLSKNAGRVLKVQEVLRITDEGGEFYFKYPGSIKVASDGHIYMADEGQFLKFSPEGKFIKNMFIKGQGPGEIQSSFAYELRDNKICIFDYRNRKVIYFDNDGNLLEELSFKEKGSLRFIGIVNDSMVFSRFKMPEREEMTGKIIDMENQVVSISLKDKTEREIAIITTKWWFAPNMGLAVDPLIVIMSSDGQKLYIDNTQEYLIRVMDIKTGNITKMFRRKYKRVKVKKAPPSIRSNIPFKRPEREFEFDIRNFYDRGEILWVRTSTADKIKGALFDVFDNEGNYVDNFYLNADGSLVATHEDYIFVRETDEDGMISIVKYKITE